MPKYFRTFCKLWKIKKCIFYFDIYQIVIIHILYILYILYVLYILYISHILYLYTRTRVSHLGTEPPFPVAQSGHERTSSFSGSNVLHSRCPPAAPWRGAQGRRFQGTAICRGGTPTAAGVWARSYEGIKPAIYVHI